MDIEISDQTIVQWGGHSFQWVLTADGRKAVRASEVVQALGKPEKDTARLVMQNVFPDFRFQSSFGQASRPAWYLYEHGAIQLATLTKTPEAEAFQRWVFDVVVKIFASGYYLSASVTSEQIAELEKEVSGLKAQRLDTQKFLNQQRELIATRKSSAISSKDRIQFAFDLGEVNDASLKERFQQWALENAKPSGYDGMRWVGCYFLKHRFEDKHKYIPQGCMVLWLEEMGFHLRQKDYVSVNRAHNYDVYFVRRKDGTIAVPSKASA